MEKPLPTEKQTNEPEKKEWVTPEMQEININLGAAYQDSEGVAYRPSSS